MANFDYSQDGAALGDAARYTISPFDAIDIDPDEARLDQHGAMAKLQEGGGPATGGAPYEEAQNNVPRRPGLSENGNELPAGLKSRATSLPGPVETPATATEVAQDSQVAPEKTARDYAMQAMAGMAENQRGAGDAVKQLAAQPSLASTIQPLQDKLSAPSMQPLNPRQAGYNPTQPQGPGNMPGQTNYRPGVGSRVLRGLEGAARGIAEGGVVGGAAGAIDPRAVGGAGYRDPNADFTRDTNVQGWRQKQITDQIAAATKSYEDESKRATGIAAEQGKVALIGKDLAGAANAQQTQDAGGKTLDEKVFSSLVTDQKMDPLVALQKIKAAANVKDPTLQQQYLDALKDGDAVTQKQIEKTIKATKTDPAVAVVDARAEDRPDKGGGGTGSKPIPEAQKRIILGTKQKEEDRVDAQLHAGYDKTMQPYKMADWVKDRQTIQDQFEAQIETAGGTPTHMTIGPDGRWKAEDAAAGEVIPPAKAAAPGSAGEHSLATAMKLPFNKGKTAAQVKADLIKRKYKVTP